MNPPGAALRRQRGVALLAAIVIVAMATVLAAAIAFDTGLAARRASGAAALDQAVLVAQAAEALAAYAIVEDRRASQSGGLHPSQNWARPIGPVEIVPGVTLSARVEDLQGRFNINNLVDAEGKPSEAAIAVLERLFERTGIGRDWVASLVDWIDPDVNPSAGGAEDAIYLGQSPGYRAANRRVTSPSELLALKDFGSERYLKIAPYVTALPRGTRLNVCTASAQLLDAVADEDQWGANPQALERARSGKCFPARTTFRDQIAPAQLAKLEQEVGIEDTSDWFELRSVVTIGTSEFALYSLLRYEGASGSPRVRVVQRGFAE
jgi:general secretion pathway protein K